MKLVHTLEVAEDHPRSRATFRECRFCGALLLDAALHVIERDRNLDLTQWQVTSAKFLEAVRRGRSLAIEHGAASRRHACAFAVRIADRNGAGRNLDLAEARQKRPIPMTPDPSRVLEPRAIESRPEPGRSSRQNGGGYRERGQRPAAQAHGLSVAAARPFLEAAACSTASPPIFFLFSPAARRHSRRFLRLALGRDPNAADRFRHISVLCNLHPRSRLPRHEQYDRFDYTIEGEPLMRAQIDAGRGAFLLGAHMGSFEVMASLAGCQPGAARLHDDVRRQRPQDQRPARGHQSGCEADIISLGTSIRCCTSRNGSTAARSSGCCPTARWGEKPVRSGERCSAGLRTCPPDRCVPRQFSSAR